MASLNFIKGALRGKVGEFVGSSWRGKPYIKTYTKTGNPRTEKQVKVRNVFTHVANIAHTILPVVKPYTFPKPRKWTEYNQIIKINQSMIAEKKWDPSKLQILNGPLIIRPETIGAVCDKSDLDHPMWMIDWNNGYDELVYYPLETQKRIMAVGVIYNDTTGEVLAAGHDSWYGANIRMHITQWHDPGDKVYAYLAYALPPAPDTNEQGMVSVTCSTFVNGL